MSKETKALTINPQLAATLQLFKKNFLKAMTRQTYQQKRDKLYLLAHH